MIRISVVLTSLLILGFGTQIFLKISEEKYPHPRIIQQEDTCTENKAKKFSSENISQIINAHAKWIENPKESDRSPANFCEADLSGADFVMAMLAGANFRKATLHKAKLTRANLTWADFTEARLHGANFDEAMLHAAVFQDAEFEAASLQDAMLYHANLHGADLSKVKGLTQHQINMACLDQHTKLPLGLSHPKPCS